MESQWNWILESMDLEEFNMSLGHTFNTFRLNTFVNLYLSPALPDKVLLYFGLSQKKKKNV